MSDAQLEKLTQERDALKREVDLLKNAMKPQQAAETLIEGMANKTDPLNTADNEWVSAAGGGGGCCVVA